MTAMSVTEAALLLVRLTDETPEPEDVKAGWTALVVFLLLIGAVVVLGFSLVKQLRKAQAAEDAGLYDHDPVRGDADDTAAPADPGPGSNGAESESEPHQTP